MTITPRNMIAHLPCILLHPLVVINKRKALILCQVLAVAYMLNNTPMIIQVLGSVHYVPLILMWQVHCLSPPRLICLLFTSHPWGAICKVFTHYVTSVVLSQHGLGMAHPNKPTSSPILDSTHAMARYHVWCQLVIFFYGKFLQIHNASC